MRLRVENLGIKLRPKTDLFEKKSDKKSEITAILLLALAVFVFISLITYDYGDLSFFSSDVNKPIRNFAGILGAYLAGTLLFIMGISSYALPMLIVFWAVTRFVGTKPENYYFKIIGTLFLVLAASSTFSLVSGSNLTFKFKMGGIIGVSFSDFLVKYLGVLGALVTIIVLLCLSIVVATDFFIFPFIIAFGKYLKEKLGRLFSARYILKPFKKLKGVPEKQAGAKPLFTVDRTEKRPKTTGISKAQERLESMDFPVKKIKAEPEEAKERNEKAPKPVMPVEIKSSEAEKKEVTPKPLLKEPEPYALPGLDLLNSPPPVEEREITDDLTENSKLLEEILKDFDIEAKVIEANRGPVVTRYELEPGVGVKVHRITSLSDNIALAMKAESIRIVAPVPGKGTIGIEVPNSKSTLVYLREILESDEYKKEESKLKMAIGKDIAGEPVITDLSSMPHLLIAGATGSGKTVCVNSIILSLLFNATPEEIRFIMVDPKKVELAPFNDLPHLLCPVVTDYKKVPVALDWLVHEMETRYELFAKCGVRNIDFYNKKALDEKWEPLYYIIVIIDELADLMMVAQEEIETAITRLAQLSRAVGIHMILATQRPSVDVITGVIKANFPARISFKVASKVDSRTVLDMNGADKLLGKGDMLLVEPGTDKPLRAQGSLMHDEEIDRVVEYIKNQRRTEYIEEITKVQKKSGSGSRFQKDEIYEEAVKIVLQTRQASVSMVQRKLGVGYTKAARLIDMMEDEGIVGPYQGSKPREILVESVEEPVDEEQ